MWCSFRLVGPVPTLRVAQCSWWTQVLSRTTRGSGPPGCGGGGRGAVPPLTMACGRAGLYAVKLTCLGGDARRSRGRQPPTPRQRGPCHDSGCERPHLVWQPALPAARPTNLNARTRPAASGCASHLAAPGPWAFVLSPQAGRGRGTLGTPALTPGLDRPDLAWPCIIL